MENGLAGIWGEEIAGAGEYLRAGEIPGGSTLIRGDGFSYLAGDCVG